METPVTIGSILTATSLAGYGQTSAALVPEGDLRS